MYAPGFYTGYAVKTLPGIRERRSKRARWSSRRNRLDGLKPALKRATATLQPALARASS
ncbi:MAG: hypothetical protein HYX76_08540 [Acidobacteria bacterium]|nr:hypothetical protein [Acidobacteriota bacterium]